MLKFLIILYGLSGFSQSNKEGAMIKKIAYDIKWFGHASLMIKLGDRNIFIDPWKISNTKEKADIILITHSHFDHYSEEDIKKIARADTFIYSSEDVISKTSISNKKVIKPFEEISNGSVTVTGFPAYNINKEFHPEKNNWLGFIIKYKGISIYVAGDTDVIDEAKKIKADIVILPVGGRYTMSDVEASELVNLIKPAYAIPIHFGDVVGSKDNALKFKSLVKKTTEVLIKNKI